MKTASVKELKQELKYRSPQELQDLCLRLSKFKKENKELLTYLLFESSNEIAYIRGVKDEIDEEFKLINRQSYYYIKKSVRKILKNTKKYIRYSQKKETEIDLLIYFCTKLNKFTPSSEKDTRLQNIYNRQIELIKKKLIVLPEELQYDYGLELKELSGD
jgi:predicted nucleotidyltransferase